MTKIIGDIKLTTLTIPLETDITFKYTFNGTDYTTLGFTFRNGQFYLFWDDRSQWVSKFTEYYCFPGT